jgi:hypothetical protein
MEEGNEMNYIQYLLVSLIVLCIGIIMAQPEPQVGKIITLIGALLVIVTSTLMIVVGVG